MTKEQKDKIILLRGQGYGYSAIAETLGLTKNQVSAYCRRNNLNGSIGSGEKAPDVNCCRGCGKPLKQIPKMKPIKFCSSNCRTRWWNSHQDMVNKKAIYSYTCPYCGKDFTAYGNSKRKYCSHACYIADRFGGESHVK